MSLQNSSFEAQTPKTSKLDSNLEKCIICQNHKTDNLSLAKEGSIKTFIVALEVRKDDVFERILTVPILVQTSRKCSNKKLNCIDPVTVRIQVKQT